jgi:DNA-binding transcriptional ArsR family regulator
MEVRLEKRPGTRRRPIRKKEPVSLKAAEDRNPMQLEAELLQRAADILRTVAHPVRLGIIGLLEQGERPVNEICRRLDTAQPYISQQLNLMKAKGVLASRRDGTQVYYSIANPAVVKIIHCVQLQSQGSGEEPADPVESAAPASRHV